MANAMEYPKIMAATWACAFATLTTACALLSLAPTHAHAHGTAIAMTGIVPTMCETSFSRVQAAADGHSIDLGLMTRRCNDGAGYRVILHTAPGLSGAAFVAGDRRVPLSPSGVTVVIDSRQDERVSEPVHIDLARPLAPGAFTLHVETVAKGPIF